MVATQQVFAVANFSVYFVSIKIGGMGKHMYDVTYEEYNMFYAVRLPPFLPTSTIPWRREKLTKTVLTQFHIPRNILWWLSLGAVKVSIALFYMRLQGFTSRRWMLVHWSLFTFTVLITALAFFIGLLSTIPVRAGFDRAWAGAALSSPDEVRQIEAQKIILALNGLHIATDILFLIVPVAMLWKVQMRWTIKMRVWIVGIVGVGNIALGLVRTQSNNWLGKDVFCEFSTSSLLPSFLSVWSRPLSFTWLAHAACPPAHLFDVLLTVSSTFPQQIHTSSSRDSLLPRSPSVSSPLPCPSSRVLLSSSGAAPSATAPPHIIIITATTGAYGTALFVIRTGMRSNAISIHGVYPA